MNGHGTAGGRTGFVQFKDGCDFLGGPWMFVDAAGDVNGGGLNAAGYY